MIAVENWWDLFSFSFIHWIEIKTNTYNNIHSFQQVQFQGDYDDIDVAGSSGIKNDSSDEKQDEFQDNAGGSELVRFAFFPSK